MLDDDLIAFLESGCSTVVGVVTPSGEPFATRGWGIAVLDAEPATLRVLLGAGALASIGRRVGDVEPFALALTGADVRTLRSVQVKGTAHGLEAVTPADEARSRRYFDAFVEDIIVTDAIPRSLMERLVPADLVACTVEVAEIYDQTPGPGAGAVLASRPR